MDWMRNKFFQLFLNRFVFFDRFICNHLFFDDSKNREGVVALEYPSTLR